MDDSISEWIFRFKSGDALAAQHLWEAYFHRLTAMARRRLAGRPQRHADEEDVAISVFDSLCRGATRGRYPQLADREGLWALLVVMTARKVCDYIAAERTQKRGCGDVAAASELQDDALGRATAMDQLLSREPEPEAAAVFAEECDRLLDRLAPELREIALAKLEGWTNEELAAKFDCGLRTIERRLRLIRKVWESPVGESSGEHR